MSRLSPASNHPQILAAHQQGDGIENPVAAQPTRRRFRNQRGSATPGTRSLANKFAKHTMDETVPTKERPSRTTTNPTISHRVKSRAEARQVKTGIPPTAAAVQKSNTLPNKLTNHGPAKITHLGQIHESAEGWSGEDGTDYLAYTVASQTRIAEYLLAHPDAVVFKEAVTRTWDQEAFKRATKKPKSLVNQIAQTFPNGFEVETTAQMLMVAERGAATILFALGNLAEIHPTSSLEEHKEMAELVQEMEAAYGDFDTAYEENEPFRQYVDSVRELRARENIASFLESPKYKGQEIILI